MEQQNTKQLNCYLCWYKSDFNTRTEYVFVFAYTAKEAYHYFIKGFGGMIDFCDYADFYKSEEQFKLHHEAGEIWGGATAII